MARARIESWTDHALSPDRECLWVTLNTIDEQKAEIEIPLREIGAMVQTLVAASDFAAADMDPIKREQVVDHMWSPIPIRSMALGAGRHSGQSVLVVVLAGFELVFGLSSKQLSELGTSLSQTLQTLSAGGARQGH